MRPLKPPIARSRPEKPVAAVAPAAEKLVARKQEWAAADRLLAPETPETPRRNRLPPGQTRTDGLPILDLGTRPAIPADEWRLDIGGLCDAPLSLTLEDLRALGMSERMLDVHCVTGWSRFDLRVEGVAMTRVLDAARPLARATDGLFRAHDGYATALPLKDLRQAGVMLATHFDGTALTREHGGPVRLVAPHLYFWKSVKWPRSLRLIDGDVPGYWEARGYHRRGDPWRQQRYR